jgi:hypothetical protein
MELSQEPSFQVAKTKFDAKVKSFVWVYVRLGWEQREIDGKLM